MHTKKQPRLTDYSSVSPWSNQTTTSGFYLKHCLLSEHEKSSPNKVKAEKKGKQIERNMKHNSDYVSGSLKTKGEKLKELLKMSQMNPRLFQQRKNQLSKDKWKKEQNTAQWLALMAKKKIQLQNRFKYSEWRKGLQNCIVADKNKGKLPKIEVCWI